MSCLLSPSIRLFHTALPYYRRPIALPNTPNGYFLTHNRSSPCHAKHRTATPLARKNAAPHATAHSRSREGSRANAAAAKQTQGLRVGD